MFQKIKSVIYQVAFMILFFALAKSCVTDYVKGGDKDKIAEWEQMIEDHSVVVAELSNEYTETTVARVVKLYDFDYSFELYGQLYTGEITLNKLPNTNQLKLYYLMDNPNIVSADPVKDLESENEKGNSITDLLVGIMWAVFAVLLLLSLLAEIKKKKSNTSTQVKAKENTVEKKSVILESGNEPTEAEKLEKERIRKEKEDPSRFMPK